jgi:hypothetical protein
MENEKNKKISDIDSTPISVFDQEIPSKYNKFNWGAFFAAPLYVLLYGKWKLFCSFLVIILLRYFCKKREIEYGNILEILLYVINIALRIYVGVVANKIAWKVKWSSFEKYVAAQRNWNIFGIIMCSILLIIWIFGVLSK